MVSQEIPGPTPPARAATVALPPPLTVAYQDPCDPCCMNCQTYSDLHVDSEGDECCKPAAVIKTHNFVKEINFKSLAIPAETKGRWRFGLMALASAITTTTTVIAATTMMALAATITTTAIAATIMMVLAAATTTTTLAATTTTMLAAITTATAATTTRALAATTTRALAATTTTIIVDATTKKCTTASIPAAASMRKSAATMIHAAKEIVTHALADNCGVHYCVTNRVKDPCGHCDVETHHCYAPNKHHHHCDENVCTECYVTHRIYDPGCGCGCGEGFYHHNIVPHIPHPPPPAPPCPTCADCHRPAPSY
ncbi:hypothetical protein GGI12_000612 [Dipsacomyces acuminosporus]|nr:hypothetical protein GGI12_000612 [Dipsacomyces acuminosporus]